MDADERGLKAEIRPVEFKPTPDMYRMDTREGREAYEATLQRSGDRRPTQSVVPSQPAQNRRGQGVPVVPHQPTQNRRGPGTPVVAPGENAETYAV
jgi:hypothetical protein